MNVITKITHSEKALVLADQILFSGTSFLVTLFFARFLSVSAFGTYASVMLGVLLLINLCNALIIQPFQVANMDFKLKADYFHFLLFMQCALLLGLGFFVYVVLAWVWQLEVPLFPLIYMGLGLLLYDFLRKYLLGRAQLNRVLLLDGMMSLASLSTLGYFFLVNQHDLARVFMAIGIVNSSVLVVFLVGIKPRFLPQQDWRIYWRYHRQEGTWLSLVALVQFGSSNFFIISLGVLVNVEALSSFRLIQTLFGVLSILFQAVENYVVPKAASLYSVSQTATLHYVKTINAQSTTFIGVILLLLFFFSTQMMTLIGGENYTSYAYLIKGMCVLYFIVLIGYPVRIYIRMLVMNRTFFAGHFIAFVFSLLAVRFLLEHWQLNGVIIGLIANQLLMLLFWNYKLNQKGVYLWK